MSTTPPITPSALEFTHTLVVAVATGLVELQPDEQWRDAYADTPGTSSWFNNRCALLIGEKVGAGDPDGTPVSRTSQELIRTRPHLTVNQHMAWMCIELGIVKLGELHEEQCG